MNIVIFEDACSTTEEWDSFDEQTIKEYCDWNRRTVDGDDQFTKIDWVNDKIASIPFCEGPHFIFIKQD
jgi:hypothetical protein